MKQSILITGASDGIGLATAKSLVSQGHNLLLHGRNPNKLKQVYDQLSQLPHKGTIETYIADLSDLTQVQTLCKEICNKHSKLDVIINNAGVFSSPNSTLANGFDIRFMVNTIAPYLLTKTLLKDLNSIKRVVNLSSAAQSPVDTNALLGKVQLEDYPAYAQSKLAIIMWSNILALSLKELGTMIVSINPGSLLGSKMVQDNFGVEGGDINIGTDILCRAALSDEFINSSGKYFDNDSKQFADPHPDALDTTKCEIILKAIETSIDQLI